MISGGSSSSRSLDLLQGVLGKIYSRIVLRPPCSAAGEWGKAVAIKRQAVHRMGDGQASSPPASPHKVRGRLRRRDCESSSSDDSSFEDEAEGQIAESAERPQTRPGQSQAGALHVAGAGPAVKEFYVDDEVDVQIAGNWLPAVVVAKSGSGRHAEYTCRTKELNEKKSRNRFFVYDVVKTHTFTAMEVRASSIGDWLRHVQIHPLEVGDRVIAQWRYPEAGRDWYPGIIRRVNPDSEVPFGATV